MPLLWNLSVQLLIGPLICQAVNPLGRENLDIDATLQQRLYDRMGFIGRDLNGELMGLDQSIVADGERDAVVLKYVNGPLVHTLHTEVVDIVVSVLIEKSFFIQLSAGGVDAGGKIFIVSGVGVGHRSGIFAKLVKLWEMENM